MFFQNFKTRLRLCWSMNFVDVYNIIICLAALNTTSIEQYSCRFILYLTSMICIHHGIHLGGLVHPDVILDSNNVFLAS